MKSTNSKLTGRGHVGSSAVLGVKESCNRINILKNLVLVFFCLVSISAQAVNHSFKISPTDSIQIAKHWSGCMSDVWNRVSIVGGEISVWPNMQNYSLQLAHEGQKQMQPSLFVTPQKQPVTECSPHSCPNQSSEKWRIIFEASMPILYVLAIIAGWVLYGWIDDIRHRGVGSRISGLLTPNGQKQSHRRSNVNEKPKP